jgi:hypothetical protein
MENEMADQSCRTDKKQHFSEKVTKVESILAADAKKVQEKVVVAEPKSALSPVTNKGTWASMLKK